MPAIEIANQPLEKVLTQIKAQLPGFDFRIARENVPHDYPVLPDMRVENVSLTQFFDLISAEIPGIEVDARTRGFSNFDQPNPNTQIFCYLTVKPKPNSDAPDVGVRVFDLTKIIRYRADIAKGDGDRERQASDEILSLIQAALDTAGDSPKPVMKIHWPTRSLIFKGTKNQADMVSDAIKSFDENQMYKDALFEAETERDQLKVQLQKLQNVTTKPVK